MLRITNALLALSEDLDRLGEVEACITVAAAGATVAKRAAQLLSSTSLSSSHQHTLSVVNARSCRIVRDATTSVSGQAALRMPTSRRLLGELRELVVDLGR